MVIFGRGESEIGDPQGFLLGGDIKENFKVENLQV